MLNRIKIWVRVPASDSAVRPEILWGPVPEKTCPTAAKPASPLRAIDLHLAIPSRQTTTPNCPPAQKCASTPSQNLKHTLRSRPSFAFLYKADPISAHRQRLRTKAMVSTPHLHATKHNQCREGSFLCSTLIDMVRHKPPNNAKQTRNTRGQRLRRGGNRRAWPNRNRNRSRPYRLLG